MTESAPQNDLERLLVQATADVGARPAFYRAFLDSTMLVICNIANIRGMQADGSGRGVAKLQDVQSIVQMQDPQGNLVIPVFSSFPRLQETHAGRVACVRLKGRELLDLLGSAKPIVLNPMSEYSKEFTPPELASLRDGSMFMDPAHRTYPPDARVLPGLPVGYPVALVDALASLFARYPGITRAYLARIDPPGSAAPPEPPHPIVGLDLTDDWFDIVRDAGVVAREFLGEGQYVDFLPLRKGDALSDYMLRNMEPFYVQARSEPTETGAPFPDDVDPYPAGPELDALLAERVLGARIERKIAWGGYQSVMAIDPQGVVLYIMVSPHNAPLPLWNPSTDLSDAEALLQQLYMRSDFRGLSEEGTDESGYVATLWALRPLDTPHNTKAEVAGMPAAGGPRWALRYSVTGSGPTRALALCRAVYKAAAYMEAPRAEGG
jgi:hypothetical protein